MNFTIILLFLITLLRVNCQEIENADDVCKTIQHYNSPTITCCAMERYDPAGINFFDNNEKVKSCKDELEITGSKILVKKTWLLYKCVVTKIIGIDPEKEQLTIDKFTDFMVKRFPENIQQAIKDKIKIMKQLPPNTNESHRRKRNLRVKRDNADDESTESSIVESTEDDNQEETDTESPDGQNEAAETESPGGGESKEDKTENKEPESTNPPKTEEKEDKKNENNQNENERPPLPDKTIPVYEYLSAFEYSSTFEHLIPDVNIARIWDMYYVAEFEVCQKESGKEDKDIKEFGSDRCYSWIMKTARAGDCCGVAPIPTPLTDEPIIDRETIQNFTADHVFSIPGNYIFTNLTYSSNIDKCYRLAVAILQNKVKLDDLKTEIDDYIKSNSTNRPNYDAIVDNLVPPFYSKEMIEKLKQEVIPKYKRKIERKDENGGKLDTIEEYYYDIDTDITGDIAKISDTRVTMYKWAIVSEWESLNVTKARYLMWNCDAYKIISQRIKYFDAEAYCYEA